MTDQELKQHLIEIYRAIRDLRKAHFQSNLCLQSLRLLIRENPQLENRYGEIFSALEVAPDAHLFPALIAELDRVIDELRRGTRPV